MRSFHTAVGLGLLLGLATGCDVGWAGGDGDDVAPQDGESTRERVGLNAGDMTSCERVPGVVAAAQAAGVGWVRLEIIGSRPPSYWSGVVDRFRAAGIEVLAVIDNTTWSGGTTDPDEGNCPSYSPGPFGDALATRFIREVDPYVQALKDRVSYWELWNEANIDPTYVCPANYGYLIVEARLAWPGLQLGVSTNTLGFDDNARDYLDELADTEKVQYWTSSASDGGAPWQYVFHHPYPRGEEPGADDPAQIFPAQARKLTEEVVLPRPVWFTEMGWMAGNGEEAQAQRLRESLEVAVHQNVVGRAFWFSLYDCVPGFGLIDGCYDPGARRRSAYGALAGFIGGNASAQPVGLRDDFCSGPTPAPTSSTYALDFHDGDARRNSSTGDWRSGSFKAECEAGDVIVGLSTAADGQAGAAVCHDDSDAGVFPAGACTTYVFDGGDARGTTSTGDWDVERYKGECATGEYMAGLSQRQDHQVDSILCCAGQVSHSACNVAPLSGGQAVCGAGQYAAGVSRVAATGAPSRVLCCSR